MTLGLTPKQVDLLRSTAEFCEGRVSPGSIYAVLHRECFRLFPDEMFADLFGDIGRRSVPPMIVAVVMVLQRIEGLSDREAVDRFCFDARWKYAAGGLAFDYPEFVHTVLVDMRARLARSQRPDRIFNVVLEVAKAAGLVGRRRVVDSAPIYDAVATMDTVTLIRSAIRGLLAVAEQPLAGELRTLLARADDYTSAGKPVCDWDDAGARERLVDALAKDAMALLVALEGRELEPAVAEAVALLATVVGQDLDADAGGGFSIARRVAKDRVISTVDRQARHGHKTAARGFDGYKGNAAMDPDSEIITATKASAGNAGDASVAEDLIADLLEDTAPAPADPAGEHTSADADASSGEPAGADAAGETSQDSQTGNGAADPGAGRADGAEGGDERAKVYGDCAYGTGEFQSTLEDHGVDSGCRTQPPSARGGLFSKDDFGINLNQDTVTCPAEITVPIRRQPDGGGTASFTPACAGCPLRERCTTAAGGRTISINPHEDVLARARARCAEPAWQADYRATRPKVERKIAHLMRRRHGGRRARVRGLSKVDADFRLLAAAVNLARLGVLGLTHTGQTWVVSPG